VRAIEKIPANTEVIYYYYYFAKGVLFTFAGVCFILRGWRIY